MKVPAGILLNVMPSELVFGARARASAAAVWLSAVVDEVWYSGQVAPVRERGRENAQHRDPAEVGGRFGPFGPAGTHTHQEDHSKGNLNH